MDDPSFIEPHQALMSGLLSVPLLLLSLFNAGLQSLPHILFDRQALQGFELRRLLLSHELFPCMEIPPHKSLYSMGHHSKNHQVRCCSDCAAICPLGNVTSAAMHVTGQR